VGGITSDRPIAKIHKPRFAVLWTGSGFLFPGASTVKNDDTLQVLSFSVYNRRAIPSA
jgi:hypothetical protein